MGTIFWLFRRFGGVGGEGFTRFEGVGGEGFTRGGIGCVPSSDEGGSYRPLICVGNKSLPKSTSLSDSDPLKFLGAIFCSSE